MIEQAFNIPNKDGYNIHGMMYCNGTSIKPTVIISHGFTASMHETIRFKDCIVESGYHCVLFDFCGGGFESSSEGSFHDYMTPITEMHDLACVYEYVKGLNYVDESAIYLMGCSQGGFVSTLAARELNFKGLMLIYPALCIPDDARKGQMQVMQFDPNNIPDHIGEMPMCVSGEYPRSVINLDIYEELKKYKGSVFLIHGTDDAIVPFHYAEKAYALYQENGNPITYHVVENGDHGFHSDAFLTEAKQAIKEYLKGQK